MATLKITVTGTNDAPVAVAKTDAATEGGAVVTGQVVATDLDNGQTATLVYSLTSGPAPAGLTFNPNGSYSFDPTVGAYDHLAAGVTQDVVVSFKANDGTVDSNVATLKITVTGTNDAPVVAATDITGAVTEAGSPVGNLIDSGTIAFADVDLTDVHALSAITPSGGALGSLTANVTTDTTGSGLGGLVTWNYSVAASAVEFLAAGQTKVETFSFNVLDGKGGSVARTVSVTVTGTNDAPMITSNGAGANAAVSVAENTTAVTTVTATDVDLPAQSLTYSLVGGADQARFTVNATTGVLVFASAPNFEVPTDSGVNNIYDVIVRASDGALFDDQAIAVTVTGVNDITPVITSNGGGTTTLISVAENSTAVTTVIATDADLPAQTLTYSIQGGSDAAKFKIDASTGALAFVAAPNFEAPTDAGANNVYDVVVRASDGTLFDDQAIAVTVTGVNDITPVITSNGGGMTASVSVAENSTAVTTVSATDADLPAQTLTYSLVGGADQAKFTINAATGALAFASAPNFEAPTDSGANNVYDVTVGVSDGSLTDTQAISVTVTDLVENRAPVAIGEAIVISDDITIVSKAWILGNDTDPDGDSLTFGTLPPGLSADAAGNLLINQGLLQGGTAYTPPGQASYVVYSLNYTVSDGNGGTSTPTVLKLAIVDTTSGENVVNLNTVAGNLGGTYAYSMINAQNGADSVSGTAALDTFIGGAGDDKLTGGAGADTLTGDAGRDTFVFNSSGTTGADTITDFRADNNSSNGDFIELSAAVFGNITNVNGALSTLDFATVNSATGGNVFGQSVASSVNVVFDVTTGALFYDANGGLLADAVQIASLQFSGSVASDFGFNDVKVGL